MPSLLGRSDVRRMLVSVGLWQLSYSPLTLGGLLLCLQRSSGITSAGLALGAAALVGVGIGLVEARLVQRHRPVLVMVPLGLMSAALTLYATLGLRETMSTLIALAMALGLRPNLASVQRALWQRFTADVTDQQRGHAWLGAQTPVLHGVGPLLVSAAFAAQGPELAVVGGALMSALAFLLAASVPQFRSRVPAEAGDALSASPGLSGDRRWRLLCLASLLEMAAVGLVTLGAVTVTAADGREWLAGVALGAMAFGGVVAGALMLRAAEDLNPLHIAVVVLLPTAALLALTAITPAALLAVPFAVVGFGHTAFHTAVGILAVPWSPARRTVEGVALIALTHAVGDAMGRASGGLAGSLSPGLPFAAASLAFIGAYLALNAAADQNGTRLNRRRDAPSLVMRGA